MKQLRIKLDYLAKTYGFDVLTYANVEVNKDGTKTLILEGEKK